ncbi:MAG: hypothetical protein ACYTG2_02320 [Planctomycetota bacterium]
MEVLIATVLVGTALVAASAAFTGAVKTQDSLAGEPTTALALAREIHGLALLLPRDAGDGVPATLPSEVAVLDDLDGATFSPPVDAGLTVRSEATGWSQAVDIARVDLASPGTLAVDADGDDALLRLTVTVKQGADVAGTYSWWINP